MATLLYAAMAISDLLFQETGPQATSVQHTDGKNQYVTDNMIK